VSKELSSEPGDERPDDPGSSNEYVGNRPESRISSVGAASPGSGWLRGAPTLLLGHAAETPMIADPANKTATPGWAAVRSSSLPRGWRPTTKISHPATSIANANAAASSRILSSRPISTPHTLTTWEPEPR
jgi:hypothetical protein